MALTLSAITIYPVKSMAGIALQASILDKTGLRYDRRWMLVDTSGTFITQRTHPKMALIQPSISTTGQLSLRYGQEEHSVPFTHANSPRRTVTVWQDTVMAEQCSPFINEWLSSLLEIACELVYLPTDSIRACDPHYAQADDQTSFADGFPLLLISQASLNDLNQRLVESVSMTRFRPNLVVTGCAAYAEDQWQQDQQRLQIGQSVFRVIKPCPRCVVTTVDPQTGLKTGKEPLATLSQYRRQGKHIMFGQNLALDWQTDIEQHLSVGTVISLSAATV
ncbi:MAG: MOSC domain-containing protein [bacterium]